MTYTRGYMYYLITAANRTGETMHLPTGATLSPAAHLGVLAAHETERYHHEITSTKRRIHTC